VIQLRDYQRASVDAIYQHFNERDDNPLVVIPTGGGKAPTMGVFIKEAIEQWRDTRILCLVHSKELVRQNYETLKRTWPEAPATVYSAGLGQKNLTGQIVCASIQSVFRKAYELQHVDLIIVDEGHLIPHKDDGMYRQLFGDLRVINPYIKIIGYTATPFRMTTGRLDQGENRLFGKVAYEIGITDLINRGWLAPPVTRPTATRIDTSNVHVRGGEFIPSELARAVDIQEITEAACDEIVEYGRDRRSWLVFGASIDHAIHLRDAIRARGITAETINSKTPAAERDRLIAAHKAGEIRCLTNCDILTTGYDNPRVDLLGVVRPTRSPGLWVQIVGRVTRLCEGKAVGLVLDFGGNAARFGPIDEITGRRASVGGKGEVPMKECPECEEQIATSIRTCPYCGHEFPPPAPEIEPRASTDPIISTNIKPEWLPVLDVRYSRHEKPGSRPSLCVTYMCGFTRHREWVCLEHSGYPREKAIKWWARWGAGVPPTSVDDALDLTGQMRQPTHIAVKPAGKYTEIVGYQGGNE